MPMWVNLLLIEVVEPVQTRLLQILIVRYECISYRETRGICKKKCNYSDFKNK